MTQETINLLDSLRLGLTRVNQDLKEMEEWSKNLGTEPCYCLSIRGDTADCVILERIISPEEAEQIFNDYKAELKTRRDAIQKQIDEL